MSGPKVVRVVTREELLARALDQISVLESAIDRYAKVGRRHDVDTSSEVAASRKVVAELKALTQANSWDAIARRSADGVRAIEHARQVMEDNILAEATQDRMVRRRLKEAAKAIQSELQAINQPVPEALARVITRADSVPSEELKELSAAVSAASRQLTQHTASTRSINTALANRLTEGLGQDSYASWLANNAVSTETQKTYRLDKVMAELGVHDIPLSPSIKAAFLRIQAAPDEARDPLIDSLTIELGDLLRARRQRNSDLARLEGQILRLERDGSPEAQDLSRSIRTALAHENTIDANALNTSAEEFLKASRHKENLSQQRKALLSGLLQLGYEVREGMATALVENGRLVVKKPAEVEYGVEIVSAATDGRLQVRMVSFQHSSSPARDKDIEVIWCGEFSHLQALLTRAGHSLQIEKALAPGAVAMKQETIPAAYTDDVVVKSPAKSASV